MTPDHVISKTAELSAEAQRLRAEQGKHGGRHMTWPAGFRDAVAGLLHDGMTVPDIARAIGMSMSTIYGWRRQHDVKAGDRRPAFGELLVVPDKRLVGALCGQLILRTRRGHEVILKMTELAALFQNEVL